MAKRRKTKTMNKSQRIKKNARQAVVYELTKMGFNKESIRQALSGYEAVLIDKRGRINIGGASPKSVKKKIALYAASNLGIEPEYIGKPMITYKNLADMIRRKMPGNHTIDSPDNDEVKETEIPFIETFGYDVFNDSKYFSVIPAGKLREFFNNSTADADFKNTLWDLMDQTIKNKLNI